MTSAILLGSRIGKPHVRFDEEKVAPVKSKRASQLYKRVALGVFSGIAAFVVGAVAFAETAVVGLPLGYQQLEWIVAHGEESIDTGIRSSGTTSIALKLRPAATTANMRVFVSRNVAYDKLTGYLAFEVYLHKSGVYNVAFGDNGPAGRSSSVPASSERDVVIELDAVTGSFVVDKVQRIDLSQTSRTLSGQTNIRLFSKADQSGFCGRLYSATIKESGVVVRSFVPCRRLSDGAVGLYDVASHVTEPTEDRFYGNSSGAGCLDGGPIVRTPTTVAFAPDTQTATVNFSAAAESRTLRLVYGERDYGEDESAWPTGQSLSVPVAASETSAIVDLSSAVAPVRVLRAFLPYANGEGFYAQSASEYVQGGLYAQWDGYENAGVGLHDSTRAAPVELKGHIGDVTLSGTLPVSGDRAFLFGSGTLNFFSDHLMSKINAGEMTAEIVLAENGTLAHNGGLIAFGSTTRAFWAYSQQNQSLNGLVNAVSYHANFSGQYTNLELAPTGTLGTNTYAFALGPEDNSTTGGSCVTNGVFAKTFTRHATDCTTNDFWLGILPIQNGVKGRAKVFSIRLYDRLLSMEEMQANAAVDRRRFAVAPDEVSEACFVERPFAATLKVGESGVTADLTYTASAKDRALYVAWGRDAGVRLADWTNAMFVCTVPAKTEVLSSVSLPADVTQRSKGVRFFMVESDAKSYVQSGLFAQWDGIENEAYGKRNAALTAPNVLGNASLSVTVDGTLPVDAVDARAFDFGSGDLTFVSDDYLQKVNDGDATLEIVLAKNGTYVNNGGIFQFGNETRAFWAYQQTAGCVNSYSYHAPVSGKFADIKWNPVDDVNPNTLSFQLGPTNYLSAVFSDGDVFAEEMFRFAEDCPDVAQGSYIGILKYPSGGSIRSVRPRAKVYSIRLYSRRLTADEIAQNAAVDAKRFQGVCPAATDYVRIPVGLILVVR